MYIVYIYCMTCIIYISIHYIIYALSFTMLGRHSNCKESLGMKRDITNEYVYLVLLGRYQYSGKHHPPFHHLCDPPLSTPPESPMSSTPQPWWS